jgi:hypothetical protein
VFRRFLGAFARPEHPLALFLDDLQMTGRSREPFFDAQKTRAKTIASALRCRNFLRFNSSSGVAQDFDCLV